MMLVHFKGSGNPPDFVDIYKMFLLDEMVAILQQVRISFFFSSFEWGRGSASTK